MLKLSNVTPVKAGPAAARASNAQSSAHLPDEIWRDVIETCGPMDRAALASTSRQLRRLTNEPQFWRQGGTDGGVQSEKRREQWHESARCLSSFGRCSLREAFAAAEALDVDRFEDHMANVACDAEVNGGHAPEVDFLWASMVAGLVKEAVACAEKGSRIDLDDAKQKCLLAKKYLQIVGLENFFRTTERKCEINERKERVKRELKMAKSRALEGKTWVMQMHVQLAKILALDTDVDVPSDSEFHLLEEFSLRAAFCHKLRAFEKRERFCPALVELENMAILAHAEVPVRLYLAVLKKCETDLDVLAKTHKSCLKNDKFLIPDLRKLRSHCLSALAKKDPLNYASLSVDAATKSKVFVGRRILQAFKRTFSRD